MSRLTIIGGQLKLVDGGRSVLTTDGLLVNLLPPENDYNETIDVAFPDFTKDYCYNWWWTVSGPVVSKYNYDNGCRTQYTIPKQDWSNVTTLFRAPTGANIFVAMIRINRILAPTHNWAGNPVQVLPETNAWLPFTGSVLVEAEIGMARAFSLYITGGNLVLHQQQSISVPPGGYGYYGDPASPGPPSSLRRGGEWVYSSKQGIPVYPIDIQDSSPTQEENGGLSPKMTHRRGQGGGACATALPASLIPKYASTYRVEITGKFGRRA